MREKFNPAKAFLDHRLRAKFERVGARPLSRNG
jgi:hypothetical protein